MRTPYVMELLHDQMCDWAKYYNLQPTQIWLPRNLFLTMAGQETTKWAVIDGVESLIVHGPRGKLLIRSDGDKRTP